MDQSLPELDQSERAVAKAQDIEPLESIYHAPEMSNAPQTSKATYHQTARPGWVAGNLVNPLVNVLVVHNWNTFSNFYGGATGAKIGRLDALPERDNTDDRLGGIARTLSSGLGTAITYASIGKLLHTSGGMVSGALARHSVVADRVLASDIARTFATKDAAQIGGAAIYDYNRDLHGSETKVGNALGGAIGFGVMSRGHALIGRHMFIPEGLISNSVALAREYKFDRPVLKYAANQIGLGMGVGSVRLASQALVGAGGAIAQTTSGELISTGSLTSVGSALADGRISDGAMLGVLLPRVSRGLSQSTAKLSELVSPRPLPEINAPGSNLDLAEQNLMKMTESLPVAERERISMSLERFRQRAQQIELPPQEVLGTYHQIGRLMDANLPSQLSLDQRQLLAQQVSQMAGDTIVRQGRYKTCAVAALQSRAFTLYPARAARLITDVALGGEYTTHDGAHTVKIDPTAHGDSLMPSGDRLHASQIFQVTAANLGHIGTSQRSARDLRYVQQEPLAGEPGDTGERLYDYSGVRPVEMARFPSLHDFDIRDANNFITGETSSDAVLWGAGQMSLSELHSRLSELRQTGRLPVIASVNIEHEPFKTDAGYGGQSEGWHAITINGFEPATGSIGVQNQWSSASDYPLDVSPLNLSTMHRATRDKGLFAFLSAELKARPFISPVSEH